MGLPQLAVIQKPADSLTGPALRTFFAIAEAWALSVAEQIRLLGSPGRSTFYRWKAGYEGELAHDVIERISYILGIYKALQILFPDPKQADTWIRRLQADGPLAGTSALARMLGGQVADLYVVRTYLDGQRGW